MSNAEDNTPPTEESAERRLAHEPKRTTGPAMKDDLGRAEELGHDEVGDIADEGKGHRG